MPQFNYEETGIEGLIIINPFVVSDERGYYIKSFEKDIMAELGVQTEVQEVCGSLSHKGVIRGLHFQTQHAQSKLVRCAYGELFDVAVDLRNGSKTFGKWFSIRLTHENNKMLFIPSGFAHGVMALSDVAILSYHSGEKYLPLFDSGIVWNDCTLNIDWPLDAVGGKVILSEKDMNLQTFQQYCENIVRD